MPPRRSHKKSKAGCQRCKQRKIKCDEIHPTCGNCSKHGVSCDFESPGTPLSNGSPVNPPPSFLRQNTADSTSHASSASTPSSHSTIMPLYQTPTQMIRAQHSPTASRSLEFKLMHHYTTNTSQTLSNAQDEKFAWQVGIPSIAYDAQYLMDAIYAVSALHLRSIHPNDQSLVRASHSYMASALAQYSSLLNSGLSEFNAEALFSTSALIAFQASASRRFDDEHSEGGYVLPLAWFHSFQGVKTVVMASWRWLRNSEKVFPIINSQPPLALDLDPDRKLFFAPLLEGLQEQLDPLPEYLRADTRQAFEHSVAFLNWAHLKPERARILGFAAMVSRRFVELIGIQDPRALVIISCFFALTKVIDDVWWLQGVAKREVMGIFSLLPQEWWSKMEWPMRVANHEGPMDEHTWGGRLSGEGEGQFKVEQEYDGKDGSVRSHIDMLAQIMNDSAPPMPPD